MSQRLHELAAALPARSEASWNLDGWYISDPVYGKQHHARWEDAMAAAHEWARQYDGTRDITERRALEKLTSILPPTATVAIVITRRHRGLVRRTFRITIGRRRIDCESYGEAEAHARSIADLFATDGIRGVENV